MKHGTGCGEICHTSPSFPPSFTSPRRGFSGIIGRRVLSQILHEMKPRGLEMRKSSLISLNITLQSSVILFLLKIGCFNILYTLCIVNNEGHPTNVISCCNLLETFQIQALYRASITHELLQAR